MKKSYIVIGVLVLLVLFVGSRYNGMKKADIAVDKSWSNVESQYQRRVDLIGNLVNTVKGAADFEKSTLEAVIKARANATSIKVDPTNMTAAQMQEFQAAQGQLSQSLGRLLVTVERYPELKANQNFLKLQDELAGTENRINYSRDKYNDAVQVYEEKTETFPNAIYARLLGFKERHGFKADEGASKAPEVKF
ncbi:MAG: LemA family protein [Flavipsychrobacter sp.]